MSYIVQFAIGGSILVAASMLSKSKYLFLSGVITLLPIMTLINISLQMKNMNLADFRITQKNAIFGAVGAVVLMSSIFLLTNWLKPLHAVAGAFIIYVFYMMGYMYFISQKVSM
ncbi:membrane protein [Bacillus sp. FJAT-27231]|uniref:GlpM family protein n=1 Tax=Bacillus sp. FJAT-27231 TaxID=1679168 RepID=UPI00067113EC|nr:membrane protein [Bacillus sp. FJAT-27231]